jgi:hypothetical protein
MGIRIIEGNADGSETTCAVLYCSTTMVAFGPIFDDVSAAEEFLAYTASRGIRDLRNLDDREYGFNSALQKLYEAWRAAKESGARESRVEEPLAQ